MTWNLVIVIFVTSHSFRKFGGLFVNDLWRCFRCARVVAIVHSPNERYVFVHGRISDGCTFTSETYDLTRIPRVTGVTFVAIGIALRFFCFG